MMKETREITYRCGHTETVKLFTGKTGRDGKSYLDWQFENLGHEDCTECKRKNGAEMKMKMYYRDGIFYAGIVSGNSYSYKEILKEAGMTYDDSYNWNFHFSDLNYEVELEKKIELLSQKNIVITEIIDEEAVYKEALRSLRWETMNECCERMISEAPEYLQIFLRGTDKDIPKDYMEEYEKNRASIKEEMKRIQAMSLNQLEVYRSGARDPMSDQEVEEFKLLRKSAVLEVKDLLPSAPEFAAMGRWNQKVYDDKGRYFVYINNEKREISHEQYVECQEFEWGAECFVRLKKKINAMNLSQLREKKYLGELEEEELRRKAQTEAETEIVLEKPDCIKGYYWNGNYYGENKRNIYRDNVQYTLSDKEFKSIQDYQASLKKYKDALKAINDMSLDDLRRGTYRQFFTHS